MVKYMLSESSFEARPTTACLDQPQGRCHDRQVGCGRTDGPPEGSWSAVRITVSLAIFGREYGSVTSLWAEFGCESSLVVAMAGVALVVSAPAGPVLDLADGAQPAPWGASG